MSINILAVRPSRKFGPRTETGSETNTVVWRPVWRRDFNVSATGGVGGGVVWTAYQRHHVGLHHRRRAPAVGVVVAARGPPAVRRRCRRQEASQDPRRSGRLHRAVRRARGHVPQVRRRPRWRPPADAVWRQSAVGGVVRVT